MNTRAPFVSVYLDPLLYILATFAVVAALKSLTYPLDVQYTDFVQFWDRLHWQFAGHDLYSPPPGWPADGPNFAPPGLMLMLVPLAPLPMAVARAAWMVIGLGLFAVMSHWIARELDVPAGRVLSLLLISQPAFIALLDGGFAPLVALCVTRAWMEARADRDSAAGLWLGVATAWKPFLLPFVAYAVVRRRGRFGLGLLGGITAVLVVGLTVFGVLNTELWVRNLGSAAPKIIGYPLNGSWMGWLARALTDWSAVRVVWAGGALIIGAAWLWQWMQDERDGDREWLAVLSGGLLASPISWTYYATLMVGPFVACRSPLLWVAYGLLLLPVEPLVAANRSALWALTIGAAVFWAFVVLFLGSIRLVHTKTPRRGPLSPDTRLPTPGSVGFPAVGPASTDQPFRRSDSPHRDPRELAPSHR